MSLPPDVLAYYQALPEIENFEAEIERRLVELRAAHANDLELVSPAIAMASTLGGINAADVAALVIAASGAESNTPEVERALARIREGIEPWFKSRLIEKAEQAIAAQHAVD